MTMVERSFRIGRAESSSDVDVARTLFEAYASQLDVDLRFQGFAEELATLPGAYAAPHGVLLLATDAESRPLGCIAMRPIEGSTDCEMKRLFVTDAGRGRGIGRALVNQVVAVATLLGYRAMRLDTLPSMAAAIALYRTLGFAEIAPYYETPVAGTLFLALPLVAQR